MFAFKSLLLSASLALFASIGAAQTLERSPEPSWVDLSEIPVASPEVISNSPDGIAYLISDTQILWQADDPTAFHRITLQVIGRAGLETAAAVSIDFDPAFDRATLHRIDVWRDGRVIAWADRLTEEVFRRETRLEEGIIDGTLTAFFQVPDLRVGDVLDVSWSTQSRPPVPGGLRSVNAWLDFSVPVSQSRVLVHWPSDWPLIQGPLPVHVRFAETPGWQGARRLEWRTENHLRPRPEDNVPPGDQPDAIVRLSGWPDWSALSAALTPYYTADYPLPPDWQARIDAIAASTPAPQDRAIQALRLVQDELRYVSLSVGSGGLFARAPQEVITSGFGDCKDKALLLRILLARLGISADVALSDLDEGKALNRLVPALGAFDHAIVRINLPGGPVWVDPTASYQGGDFASAEWPDYGFALPLTGPTQTDLVAMPATPEQVWQVNSQETFLFSPLGVFLSVHTTWTSGAANWMRQRWAKDTVDNISQGYLDFYARTYPGLTLMKPVVLRDDRDANRVETTEAYFLRQADLQEEELIQNFRFGSEDFTSNLPRRLGGPRQAPLDPGPPISVRHRVKVLNAPIGFTVPDPVTLTNGAFTFELAASSVSFGQMTLSWTFQRSGQPVPAAQVPDVLRDVRRVSELTNWYWDLTQD